MTNYGEYKYESITEDEARDLIRFVCYHCLNGCDHCQDCGYFTAFTSAVGHESTAEVLTEILGVSVPVNRIEYNQQVGDIALVFKIKKRIAEGAILNREELEEIGYEFGRLERVA